MRTQLFVTVLACSLWLESLKNALVFVSRMIAGLLLFPCYIFLGPGERKTMANVGTHTHTRPLVVSRIVGVGSSGKPLG